MYTLFEVEKKQNTISTMKFSNMSPRERRTWFVNATTKVKSYTNRTIKEIAAEIGEKVPKMSYERLRSIRANPQQKTRTTSPLPAECQAVIDLYAEEVPEILSDEEQTFQERSEALKKENERIERRIAELMHEKKQLAKENEKLKAKNEYISNALDEERAKRNEIETELKETKDELLDLLRQQTKN